MGDDQIQGKSGRRHEAQPEDDFIGSENDEVCLSLWRSIGTLNVMEMHHMVL